MCLIYWCLWKGFTYFSTKFFVASRDLIWNIDCSRTSAFTHRNFHTSLRIKNFINLTQADPIVRAVQGVGLQPPACWDYSFESRRGRRCFVHWECRVLSSRNLYHGPIPRPETSYRVCVCVCVSVSVVRCNNNRLHLLWVDRKRAE